MLEKSAKAVPELIYFDEIDSTNAELVRMSRAELPEFSAVVAGSQTSGSGRLGRQWVSEPGASLSVSVLLRPSIEQANWSWFTLMAALAIRATASELGVKDLSIKWPNDVLVSGQKLSGILATIDQGDLVLGLGVNLKPQSGAPENATSLAELGAEHELDAVLSLLLSQLRARYLRFAVDPSWAIELTRNEYQEFSSTLGQRVRAIYPDGKELVGLAIDLDGTANLLVDAGEIHTVAAADIIHLRN